MSGAGRVDPRGKTTRRLTGISAEEYRPSHRPERTERSPYLTRAAETAHKEQSSGEEEVEGAEAEGRVEMEENRVITEPTVKKKPTKRADGGESRDMLELFQTLMEREAEEWEHRRRREAEEAAEKKRCEEAELELRREAEAARRKEMADAEEARRREMADMFRQFNDLDGERRMRDGVAKRDEEAARRREEDNIRREIRKEDDLAHERRELLNEKLKGLGNYKEGNELGGFLEKFERILKESGVSDKDWMERLYPRLPERLCSRVAEARGAKASYEEIKGVLLKAAGETAITYGNQLFEVTGEFFKGKNAGEMSEWLRRTAGGMCRDCKSVEDCTLVIAMALLRKILPQTFMELRKIESWAALRKAQEDWLSGRHRGNYYKQLGAGENYYQRGNGGFSGGGTSTHGSDVRGGNEWVW